MYKKNAETVYEQIVRSVFSGDRIPGSKVVEQDLADELGVSRIPVRESLGRMLGQGLLVGDGAGRGVRMRDYTFEEVCQLYEARGAIEAGVARAAARTARDADIARLNLICEQAEAEIGNYGSQRWAELDHAFHAALADASHNDRLADMLQQLLTECHYIFYLHPSRNRFPVPTPEDATLRMREVVENEHVALLRLIIAGDADGAELLAREAMQRCALQIIETHTHLEPDKSESGEL